MECWSFEHGECKKMRGGSSRQTQFRDTSPSSVTNSCLEFDSLNCVECIMASTAKKQGDGVAKTGALLTDLATFFNLGTVKPKVYDKVFSPEDNDGYVLPKGVMESGTGSKEVSEKTNQVKMKSALTRLAELKEKKRKRDVSEEDVDEQAARVKRAKRAKKVESDSEDSDDTASKSSDIPDFSDDDAGDWEGSPNENGDGNDDDGGNDGSNAEAVPVEAVQLSEAEARALKKRLSRQASRHRKAEAKAATKQALLDEQTEEGKKRKTPKRTAAEKEEAETRTVFVGNVPINADKKALQRLFSQYGNVQSVRFRNLTVNNPDNRLKAVIKGDLHPERDSMIAYIVFDSEACVKPALKANGVEFGGKHLRVDAAKKSSLTDRDYINTIYVSCLPFGAEEEDLREIFQRCGQIASIRIIRDNHYKVAKGFGYVRFSGKDAVDAALKLNKKITYKDNLLTLARAIPPSEAASSSSRSSAFRKPSSLAQKYKVKSKKFSTRK